MTKIIEWCNANDGFLTAILSLNGLLLSMITIIVSLKTARLPFKKSLKISATTDVLFIQNEATKIVLHQINGMSITAVNVGSRNVNIVFLGLAIKPSNSGIKKLAKLKEKMTGTGILAPTEITSNTYSKDEILYCLSDFNGNTNVYALAIDSEEKIYKIKIGNIKKVIKNLSQN